MKKLFAFLALGLLLYSSCGNKDSGTLIVSLEHKVGNQNLIMNDIRYESSLGHLFSVTSLRYYLSDFVFHNTEGNDYVTDFAHYRSEVEEDTREILFEDVPAGTYDKVTFIFGLDTEKNVDDGLLPTITNDRMRWPIPGDQGYHYMKFEGRFDSLATGTLGVFNTHLGATENNPNFFTVTLDLPSIITLNDNSWKIDLVMDLLEWYQNPHDYNFVERRNIMEDQSAQLDLRDNGATVFSIAKVVRE